MGNERRTSSRVGLSLQAYLAYTSSRTGSQGPSPSDMPEECGSAQSDLIWVHADNRETGRALRDLCMRLRLMRPETQVLTSGTVPPFPGGRNISLPREGVRSTARFAKAWRPGLGLVTGRNLRPALLSAFHDCGTRLIYADIEDQPFTHPGPRWLPDPTAATMALFDRMHTRDPAALRRLRRLGVPASRSLQSGRLLPASHPPESPIGGRADIAPFVAGRPIWLSARLYGTEAPAVLAAHRQAIKLAHRLLLIIVPADDSEHVKIRKQLHESGLRYCDWDQGGEPDDTTSVLITEGPEDLGLWYRIAPLAFLGGSMTDAHPDTSPLDAAALGTAILHGPNIQENVQAYERLSEHLAARRVRNAAELSDALARLIPPERSAAMALAGWDVVTEGAGQVDLLCKEIAAHLDAPNAFQDEGARDAGT